MYNCSSYDTFLKVQQKFHDIREQIESLRFLDGQSIDLNEFIELFKFLIVFMKLLILHQYVEPLRKSSVQLQFLLNG